MLDNQTTASVLALTALVAIGLARRVAKAYRIAKSTNFLPGTFHIVAPYSLWGNFILPKIPFVTAGTNSLFTDKHRVFAETGSDIHSIGSLWEDVPCISLADADAIKEVTLSRSRFPKPVEVYAALLFFGKNIVASGGEQWKRYRKISAPAFSERNNRLVWHETTRIMTELFEVLWEGRDIVTVDDILDITLPITLFTIGAAGFGQRMTWVDDTPLQTGHKMRFKDALKIVSEGVFMKLALPTWMLSLTPRLREIRDGFDELAKYMDDMIEERVQSGSKVNSDDLLSALASSYGGTDESAKLTTDELVGNIFIFLLAGHETSAHTFGLALALLALYQDEQERLFKHIREILPDGKSPEYEDIPRLTRVLAVVYETLRLFPSVTEIPKKAAEDTTLNTVNSRGERVVVPVPKGSRITIDTPGLHYNPRYWEKPHSFNPDRFLQEYNHDAFVPFSAGVRACLGRRFSEVETITALTMLVSRYKINVKQEPQYAHETFEQTKGRILRTRSGLTLTPIRVPLSFTKRV